jgi:hypothetical protein
LNKLQVLQLRILKSARWFCCASENYALVDKIIRTNKKM